MHKLCPVDIHPSAALICGFGEVEGVGEGEGGGSGEEEEGRSGEGEGRRSGEEAGVDEGCRPAPFFIFIFILHVRAAERLMD